MKLPVDDDTLAAWSALLGLTDEQTAATLADIEQTLCVGYEHRPDELRDTSFAQLIGDMDTDEAALMFLISGLRQAGFPKPPTPSRSAASSPPSGISSRPADPAPHLIHTPPRPRPAPRGGLMRARRKEPAVMSDDFLPRAAAPATAARPAPSWAKKPPAKFKARPTGKATARRYAAPRDPHEHARKIAENVLDAWYQSFGGNSIDVPLGTVAGLSLLRNVPGLADWVLNLKPEELPQLLKEIYLGHWIKRP